MPRPDCGGLAPRLGRSVFIAILIGAGTASAAASPPATDLTPLVRNEALARVLGNELLRDTVAVISAAPASSPVTLPQGNHAAFEQIADDELHLACQIIARRRLNRYLWLIQQAFDESLWKGPGTAQVQRSFPTIWRLSIGLYESQLQADVPRLRVCKPTDDGEDFTCADEAGDPVVVPIPAPDPALRLEEQSVSG